MDDGKRSYTAIFLPGEPARIFPTSEYEHARILQIYKQDRAHADVLNDFTNYELGEAKPTAATKPIQKPAKNRAPARPRSL